MSIIVDVLLRDGIRFMCAEANLVISRPKVRYCLLINIVSSWSNNRYYYYHTSLSLQDCSAYATLLPSPLSVLLLSNSDILQLHFSLSSGCIFYILISLVMSVVTVVIKFCVLNCTRWYPSPIVQVCVLHGSCSSRVPTSLWYQLSNTYTAPFLFRWLDYSLIPLLWLVDEV